MEPDEVSTQPIQVPSTYWSWSVTVTVFMGGVVGSMRGRAAGHGGRHPLVRLHDTTRDGHSRGTFTANRVQSSIFFLGANPVRQEPSRRSNCRLSKPST